MRTEPRRRRSESREPRALLLVPLALLRARLDRLLDFGAKLDQGNEHDCAVHESEEGSKVEDRDNDPPKPVGTFGPKVTNAEMLRGQAKRAIRGVRTCYYHSEGCY